VSPERVEAPHRTAPGKQVHVLVTDASETRGVLVYVDEHRTPDEVLRASGVGRVTVAAGETATLFPGVSVRSRDLRCELDLDRDRVDGRVFVFEEDQFEELSVELV